MPHQDNHEIRALLNNKIILVYPKDIRDKNPPLFCPCCEMPLRNLEDSIAWKISRTCYYCNMRWSGVKDIDLINGVYPDKTTDVWAEYIEIKRISLKTVINFK